MISHFMAFIFYTCAMVGILLTAFIIYKKFNITTPVHSKGLIKILDVCPVGIKKNLMIVKIKNEKFLIASGLEHTTFLAKLNNEDDENIVENIKAPKQINKTNIDFKTQIKKEFENNDEISIQKELNRQKFLQKGQKVLEKQAKENIDIQKRFQELFAQKTETNNAPKKQINTKNTSMKELLRTLEHDYRVHGSKF